MDVVNESGTLLIGTNTFAILTQSCPEWTSFSGFDDGEGGYNQNLMIGNGYDDDEERKYGDMDNDYYGDEGYGVRDSDYDVLEGQTVDEALEDIVKANKKGALAYLQE